MAQKDQNLIFRRAGHVDLVVGPGQLNRLPEILEEVAAQRCREPRLEVSLDRMYQRRSLVEESFAKFDPPRPPALRASPFQAMVRIMFGCDKFCTYCIVPKVRGPEQSRPAAEIVAEVRRLAARAAWKSRCWARRSTATRTRAKAGRCGSPTCLPG